MNRFTRGLQLLLLPVLFCSSSALSFAQEKGVARLSPVVDTTGTVVPADSASLADSTSSAGTTAVITADTLEAGTVEFVQPTKADLDNAARDDELQRQQEAYQRELKSGRTDYRRSEMEPGMQPALPEANIERGETNVRPEQFEPEQGGQGKTTLRPERAGRETDMQRRVDAERKQLEQRAEDIDESQREDSHGRDGDRRSGEVKAPEKEQVK